MAFDYTCVAFYWLMFNVERPNVHITPHWYCGLGIRKVEQGIYSNTLRAFLNGLLFSSCPEFTQWWTWQVTQNNSVLHKLVLVCFSCTEIESNWGTVYLWSSELKEGCFVSVESLSFLFNLMTIQLNELSNKNILNSLKFQKLVFTCVI